MMGKVRLLMIVLATVIGLIGFRGTADEVLATEEKQHYYMTPYNFKAFGSWSLGGDFLIGRITASSIGEADGSGGVPAIAEVNITEAGDYRLWVRDRDFATNSPGIRTFRVGVDGNLVTRLFGNHGEEGFRWTEVGTFYLTEGSHELELHDTSGFYARTEGFFLSNDLTLVPPEDKEALLKIVQPTSPLDQLPSAEFPAWANAQFPVLKSTSIENNSVKVVFYQGESTEGEVVQNEIYVKEGSQWLLVKARGEDFGVLMMKAVHSEPGGIIDEFNNVLQSIRVDDVTVSALANDFFRSGYPIWFIPKDFTVLDAQTVELHFDNPEADLTVTFALDNLVDDPKVTLEAEFVEDGAYSFLLFSGNGVEYADYETVTAPLLYVKKTVPDRPVMIPESFLFTPMATLHFTGTQSKIPGRAITSGVAMDPEDVPQDYAYPENSHFALVLRDQTGKVRPQLATPMFGTAHSLFEEGERYKVSFRIVNRLASWYDTFKHITENLYNFTDVRTNYFHSINEAIYNATDLMMDDDYGGWDPVNMAHYNMEERDMTTLANAMTAVQRYLLTGDEEILERRAVPTLAYMLSRKHFHFKMTNSKGGATYAPSPAPIGSPVANYSTAVYGGLYEMTQGRMPALLDIGVHNVAQTANLKGITDQMAMYKYTGDPDYLVRMKALADRYLITHPNAGANREQRFVSSFVYGDYIPMVAAFLAAYEATGEQRYLDAAEESGRLLATGIWSTGYHYNYATQNYTVLPEAGERPLFAERFNYWWHGDQQWRLGNIDGEAKSPQETGPALVSESAPGWLPARAGQGTEHPRTPGHGNIISMNNWAGMAVKLAEYTGDAYFETMARNAIVGRYGNYPGYYQDRALFHTMKADYPYSGPDFTSIYWHHIPVFVSMLEDYLINSVWTKSERHIAFPALYQSGYAYFASNQYGHASGNFYDETDMWLWLDRGIIEPDSVEVDYIAARKDGVLGLALLNEGDQPLETTITLGEKIPGGATYSGMATVYAADGTTTSVAIASGVFTLEIPAKGIRSVIVEIPGVMAPAFANADYVYSNNTRQTVSEHTRGKGHVIQLAPDHYYAYVYVSDMNSETDKVTMQYQIGTQSYTAEKIGYPYEFLIKVDDEAASFTYTLTAVKNAQSTSLGGGTLRATDFANPAVAIPGKGRFEPIELSVMTSGTGSGRLRFVVSQEGFPFAVTENLLSGLRITGTLTNPVDSSVLTLESTILANEVRPNGTTVLVVAPTTEVPLANYNSYTIELTVQPKQQPGSFEPFSLAVISAGRASGHNRMVVSAADFPFPVSANMLSGYRVTGVLKHKTDGSALVLDSTLTGNEMRANNQTILVIAPTSEVPYRDYNDYDIELAIHPFAPTLVPIPGDAELSHNQGSGGLMDGFYDITMNLWGGENASVYQLYENSVLVDTQFLTMDSPTEQSTVTAVTYQNTGTYRYHARLSNAFGSILTEAITVEVSEATSNLYDRSSDSGSGEGDDGYAMNLWRNRIGSAIIEPLTIKVTGYNQPPRQKIDPGRGLRQ